MDDRLTPVLRRLADDVQVRPNADERLGAAIRERADRRERAVRRRAAIALATGSFAVLAVLVVAVGANRNARITVATAPDTAPGTVSHTDSTPTRPSAPTTSSAVQAPPRVTVELDPPPLAERSGAAIVSMGAALFVWGGNVPNHLDGSEPPFADGAVYDPSNDGWRVVAESPLPGGVVSAVWTGEQVIVSNAGLLATYDPQRDTWTSLDIFDDTIGGHRPLVQLGAETVFPRDGVAWNPHTGAVRQLAKPPMWHDGSAVLASATGIIVFGADPTGIERSPGWRYTAETDRWTSLPEGPIDGLWDGAGIVGGELVVAEFESTSVAALDLATGTWRSLPPLPLPMVKCQPTVVDVAGRPVISMCGHLAVLLADEDRWALLDEPTAWGWHASLIPHDTGLFVDGGVISTTERNWYDRDVTVLGLRVLRSAGARWTSGTTVELSATGCRVDVNLNTVAAEPRAFARAQLEAQRAEVGGRPRDSVDWWTTFGRFVLSCPTVSAYTEAFASLDMAGERTTQREVTGSFDRGPHRVSDPSELVDLATTGLRELEVDVRFSDEPEWLIGPSGDSPATIEVGYGVSNDSSILEAVITVTARQNSGGWLIERVVLQYVCRSAIELGAEDTCPQR